MNLSGVRKPGETVFPLEYNFEDFFNRAAPNQLSGAWCCFLTVSLPKSHKFSSFKCVSKFVTSHEERRIPF